jgi:peptidoglycan/xylan/chitin deacetylase (PgdA/CDA1 family)
MPPAALILTFHGIGDPPRDLDARERRVWISTAVFCEVLDRVRGRDDVRLTFDDGNRSDITVALPILAERGLSATFFVVTGRVGEPGFLNADDVAALVSAGMQVGSHGTTHRSWRNLQTADLNLELQSSRAALQSWADAPIRAAACPFGAYDRRVLRALRVAGFSRAFTSDGGRADPSAWLQPRNTIRESERFIALERMLGPAARHWRHVPRVAPLLKRLR